MGTRLCIALVALFAAGPAFGQRARFKRSCLGDHHEVWRLTNDPVARDHAN